MNRVCGLIVFLLAAAPAQSAHRNITANEFVGFVSGKDKPQLGSDLLVSGAPFGGTVQVTDRLSSVVDNHMRFAARQEDSLVLVAAMRNRSLDMPARLCVARFCSS
jgi:hypothetical protein